MGRILLAGLLAFASLGSGAAQLLGPATSFAGLEWTFVRVKYHYINEETDTREEKDQPWFVDAPGADANLTYRVKSATSILVRDPIVLPLEDEDLFAYPWIFFTQPGYLRFTDDNVVRLREFLLRGGTATFDDFHGSDDWVNFEREIKRVFPDRPIVELTPPHPIFTCFFQFEQYPQIPNLAAFLAGRMWKKGGFEPHLRAITDDTGRAMVLINYNSDIGDGLEWSNAPDFPAYVPHTATAYRIMINEVVYALTR
jgi:hypothetical protein